MKIAIFLVNRRDFKNVNKIVVQQILYTAYV